MKSKLIIQGYHALSERQSKLLEGEIPQLLTYKEQDFLKTVVVYIQEFFISALKIGVTFRTNLTIGDKEFHSLYAFPIFQS